MITSKEIINLSEDWFQTIKVRNKVVDLFVNPTSSDVIKINKIMKVSNNDVIRFIADANAQKVYVWNGYDSTHDNIGRALGIYNDVPSVLFGYCKLSSGKFSLLNQSDSVERIMSFIDGLFAVFNYGMKMSQVKKEYGSQINANIDWLYSFFNYNWQFFFNSISGSQEYFNREHARFVEWKKKYDNS